MEYFSLFPSLYEINVRNLHAERCWIWFIRKSNHVYLHMFSYETQDILGILTFQSSAKPGSVGEGRVVLRHPVYWDTYLWAICYPNNSMLSTDPSREPASIHTWHFHQSSAHTPKKNINCVSPPKYSGVHFEDSRILGIWLVTRAWLFLSRIMKARTWKAKTCSEYESIVVKNLSIISEGFVLWIVLFLLFAQSCVQTFLTQCLPWRPSHHHPKFFSGAKNNNQLLSVFGRMTSRMVRNSLVVYKPLACGFRLWTHPNGSPCF